MNNDKISIRPIEHTDLEKLHKWRNDKNIFDNLGGGFFPRSRSQMNKWMDSFVDNTLTNQKFIITVEEEAIGYISLSDINYKNGNADLGLYIGEDSARGKGYAKMALNIIKDYAKNTVNMRKISLNVLEENTNAIKLYEKCGFIVCGCKRKERFVNGDYKNVILMEVFL